LRRFLLLVALFGCSPSGSGPDPADEKGEKGGGPLTYWNADGVASEDVFGSVVLEVPGAALFRTTRDAASRILVEPTHTQCSSYPVAIGIGTLRGERRMVVSDGGCGIWIADIDREFAPTAAWTTLFDDAYPDFNVDVSDVDGDGDHDVLIGGATGFTLCPARLNGGCERHDAPFSSPGLVSRVALDVENVAGAAHAILFMRDELPEIVPVGPRGLGEALTIHQRPTEYLRPFARFDQLSKANVVGCDVFAIGVGMFEVSANYTHRARQALHGFEEGSFEATTLETSLEEVEAVATLNETTLGTLVVSVGRRAHRTVLEVGRFATCKTLEVLAEAEVEFDWETPLAPEDYTEPNLPRLGVKVSAAVVRQGVVAVFHYDGFTLRHFEANIEQHEISQQNFTP
jgi:hypothetical protein